VPGISTMDGDGFHGTRGTYWIGFDATQVGKEASNVINVYKDSNTAQEFVEEFQTADSSSPAAKLLQVVLFYFSPCRRLSEARDAIVERRRLGIKERGSLHMAQLYHYWSLRAISEELGVNETDCAAYCMAWVSVNELKRNCKPGDIYTVCGTSPEEDHFCSDTFWQSDRCKCVEILPGGADPFCK